MNRKISYMIALAFAQLCLAVVLFIAPRSASAAGAFAWCSGTCAGKGTSAAYSRVSSYSVSTLRYTHFREN